MQKEIFNVMKREFKYIGLLFLLSFIIGILAVIAFIFVREAKTKEEIKPKRSVPFSFSLKNFEPKFKLYLSAVFIFGMGVMPVSLMLLKECLWQNCPRL